MKTVEFKTTDGRKRYYLAGEDGLPFEPVMKFLKFRDAAGYARNFGSLTPEQIQKYSELYKQPQMFVKMGKDIVAVPIEPKKQIGTFELFQLKSSSETRYMQFESYDRLTRHGHKVSQSNYGQVYSGKLFSGDTLDSIYERFNLHHPADFRGHSLSVSDVIIMHQNGQDQAF